MSPDIEALFYQMFPQLFRGRFKPPEESSMCYGLECEKERFFLLWNHCIELEKTAIVEGRDRDSYEWPEVSQVKEKAGTLRVYIRNESDYMRYLREKLLVDSVNGDESLL